MADAHGASAWVSDIGGYAGVDVRRDLSALLGNGTVRPFGARSGRRPGAGGVPTVSGSTVSIPAGAAVVDAAASGTDAPFAVSWTGAGTVTLAPADSSNPRVDAVFVRVVEVVGSPTTQTITFGVVTGTASSSPQRPTQLSDGTPIDRVAVLGWVTVPQSGGGNATVIPGPLSVAAGGVLPVASKAEQDAVTLADGFAVHRTDSGAVLLAQGGQLWPVGHTGDVVQLTSHNGVDDIQGNSNTKTPNWLGLTAKNWAIPGGLVTRDAWGTLAVFYYAGIGTGGSGFKRARIRIRQDGAIVTPVGRAGAGDWAWPDAASTTDTWTCPVPVRLREGVATTFTAEISLDEAAGSAFLPDWYWMLTF